DRRIAIYHVWPKNTAIRIQNLYDTDTPQSLAEARNWETDFIRMIEKRSPELIIDTSPKGLFLGVTKFGDFAKYPYPLPPVMREYILTHYTKASVIDDFTIYRKKTK
ncbi:MAG TPA: hypothetical protein VF857_08640, partial [Spirochaetota bacterium]